MNISAAELKHALKKLSPVKTETYQMSPIGFSAQDSDVLVVESSIPMSLIGGDPFNVSGKKLTQIVNRVSGQVSLVREEKKLIIRSAKAVIELEIQTIKSVPLPEAPTHALTIELAPFKKAMAVASASASSAKAAAFGGVVLFQNLPLGLEETISSGYRVTGTDAVVLTTVAVETPVNLQFRSLINLTAGAVVQLMDGEEITIGDTNKCLILRSKDTTVYASKPVQKYPDFDALLATPAQIKISLASPLWLSALRTVEPLIDETVDKGVVGLLLNDGVVKFRTTGVGSTASDESTYEQLDPDPVFDPKEFGIKVISKHLSGFLGRAGDEATLSVTGGPLRLESGNVVVLTAPVGDKK